MQSGDRADRSGARVVLDQGLAYAVRGNTVVWQARIQSKTSAVKQQAAFFLSRRRSRGKRRIVGTGEEISNGLTISNIEPSVALSEKAVAFVGISGATGDRGPYVEGIHLRRGARVATLARVGDPTPLGGVIADLIGPISMFGATVVYRALLDGTSTTEASLVSHP